MPTVHGRMAARVYGRSDSRDTKDVWVVCTWSDFSSLRGQDRVHLRVHDACLTSEILGSQKCDCAQQLRLAQNHLSKSHGILIYTPQEGRGIGLVQKIAAYNLQERKGLDTVDANLELGLPDEARNYGPVRVILDDLAVRSVVLLTNNPFKVTALKDLGICVDGRISVLASGDKGVTSKECKSYLQAKARRMGHVLSAENTDALNGNPANQLLECEECSDLTAESEEPAARLALEPNALPLLSPLPVAPGKVPLDTATAAPSPPAQAFLSGLKTKIDAWTSGDSGQHTEPYVTLTYAQSLDGSIASALGPIGPRLILSGPESMKLTHGIRALHDAIVVGSGTLLADDPKLTVRLSECMRSNVVPPCMICC